MNDTNSKEVYSAVKAIVEYEGKYLFITQEFNGKEYIDLPGGRIEHGESPYDAMHREVQEEVGLDIEIVRTMGAWWFFRDDGAQVICLTFLCRATSNQVDLSNNPAAEENIFKYEWVAKEGLEAFPIPETSYNMRELFSQLYND